MVLLDYSCASMQPFCWGSLSTLVNLFRLYIRLLFLGFTGQLLMSAVDMASVGRKDSTCACSDEPNVEAGCPGDRSIRAARVTLLAGVADSERGRLEGHVLAS